jgi:hypothetical protein
MGADVERFGVMLGNRYGATKEPSPSTQILKGRKAMRLSEAILLGDSLRKRYAYVFLREFNGETFGCALGGAGLAVGFGVEDPYAFRRIWPWTQKTTDGTRLVTLEDEIGLGCGHPSFDGVCRGEATIEQLADWVRSIEPECGECNQFECTCPKAEEVEEMEMAIKRLLTEIIWAPAG